MLFVSTTTLITACTSLHLALPPTPQRVQDSAYILAWSPDSQQLAVGSSTGLRLYDAKTLMEIAALEEEGCCGGIVMTNEVLAAIGAKNASVNVWDLNTHEILFTLNDDVINFQSLALSSDGKMLATGEQERIRLWEVPILAVPVQNTGEAVRTAERHSTRRVQSRAAKCIMTPRKDLL